ncbi:hypothetical protein CK203_064122 [Vitis vinifera]|uniref:Uncharacterized protein n=1 Tax=Vitis vinifera TaxID=29760 RepID=A0A438G658_VITVI|nr:hypothetical protein CK203_064122 [Vitis vinifera]
MVDYQQRATAHYNRKARPRSFKSGTLVLRKVFENTVETGARKFQANWEGPYIVSKTSESGAYHLQKLDGTPLLRPWNVSNLKQDPPPPDDTWHAPLSGSTLSVPPKRTHGAHLYPGPLGGHTTLSNIIPKRCSILSRPIVRIIDCNKQALLSHPRQPATAHVPPPVERKDMSDSKSPPTISDNRLQGDDDPTTTLRIS